MSRHALRGPRRPDKLRTGHPSTHESRTGMARPNFRRSVRRAAAVAFVAQMRGRRRRGRAAGAPVARRRAGPPARRALYPVRGRAAVRARAGGGLAAGGVPRRTAQTPEGRELIQLVIATPRQPAAAEPDPGRERRAHAAGDQRRARAADRGVQSRHRLLQLRRARQRELVQRGGALHRVGPGARRAGGGRACWTRWWSSSIPPPTRTGATATSTGSTPSSERRAQREPAGARAPRAVAGRAASTTTCST